MGTTQIDTREYVRLLIRAGELDGGKWPDGMAEGAVLLGRIRAIEELCRREHGIWDWELLTETMQDEYDVAVLSLNQFIDRFFPPGPSVPMEDVFAALERDRAEEEQWLTR